MKKSILVYDPIGKTKVEISNILSKYDSEIIHIKNEDELIEDSLRFNSVKLVIWCIYTEDSLEFPRAKKAKRDIFKEVPVIIVSNFNEKKYVFKAIEAGASDYIVRPFDQEFILNKIIGYTKISIVSKSGVVSDIDEEDNIVLSLKEILSINMKSAHRGNYPLSILMITLMNAEDNSSVNEREIVNILIKTIKSKVRETDLIIRYGVDNILVILPFTDHDGAYIVDKKIRRQLMSNTLLNQRAEGIALASSYVTYPQDGKTRENLIEKLQEKLQTILVFSRKYGGDDFIM